MMPELKERDDLGWGAWKAFPGVIVAPAKTYAQLAARPRWIGCCLISALLVMASAWVSLTPTLEMARVSTESTMDRLGVPEADRERALEELAAPDDRSPAVLGQYVGGGALALIVFGFLGALLLHWITRIAGRPATFRASFTLFWPAFALSSLGSLFKSSLMAASNTVEVTLGPGALLPDLAFHSPVAIFLDLFDVFSVWNLVVLVLGAERVHGVTRGGALGICGTYWGIKAVFVAGTRLFAAWMLGAS